MLAHSSGLEKHSPSSSTAGKLKSVVEVVEIKDKNWKSVVKDAEKDFPEDIIDTLNIIGKCKTKTSQNYQDAKKLLNARINNLESNLYIEIDMERIEDRSKALSYIGIQIAESLKNIPVPQEKEVQEVTEQEENVQYLEETRVEVKPSLWQRVKNSKFVRALRTLTRIRIVIDQPALPEARDNQKN